MSRKPNCRDNAPMESVFGTLKTELVHQREYPDRDAARPVRVHRSLLQSSADPLRYRLHHPRAGRPENRITPCPLSRGNVTFAEDACRVHSGNAPIALVHLRDCTHALIRRRGAKPKPAREAFAANPRAAIRAILTT